MFSLFLDEVTLFFEVSLRLVDRALVKLDGVTVFLDVLLEAEGVEGDVVSLEWEGKRSGG